MKPHYLFMTVTVSTLFSLLHAKEYSGSLSGTVYDADTHVKISGAMITLGDSIHHARSDSAGCYSIRDVAPGTYTV